MNPKPQIRLEMHDNFYNAMSCFKKANVFKIFVRHVIFREKPRIQTTILYRQKRETKRDVSAEISELVTLIRVNPSCS